MINLSSLRTQVQVLAAMAAMFPHCHYCCFVLDLNGSFLLGGSWVAVSGFKVP